MTLRLKGRTRVRMGSGKRLEEGTSHTTSPQRGRVCRPLSAPDSTPHGPELDNYGFCRPCHLAPRGLRWAEGLPLFWGSCWARGSLGQLQELSRTLANGRIHFFSTDVALGIA